MTGYDPLRHHRRSMRLKGYDYTQAGAYFDPPVTWQRECLFGEITNGKMQLNKIGRITKDEWLKTAQIRPYVQIQVDELVVMPNHLHGIIRIVEDDDPNVGARWRRAPTKVERFGKPVHGSVPTIIRAFKSAITQRINLLCGSLGDPVCHRNYYEHIIRNDGELESIRKYIQANPLNWEKDRKFPKHSIKF